MGVAAADVVARGAEVRVRPLWAVAVLLVVTGGFYYWVWYWRVNRELRDYGRAFGPPNPLDVDLRRALFAVTLGSLLVVPAAVSVRETFERIREAERLGGAATPLRSDIGLVLFVVAVVLSVAALPVVLGWVDLPHEAALALNTLAIAALGVKLAYTQHHVNGIWLRERVSRADAPTR